MKNNPWEYTGDVDSILDRHDPHSKDHNPSNYPNWSNRKWWAVQHQHNKALRVIADNTINQSQLRERQEEESKIEKENSLSLLLLTLYKSRNDKLEKTREAREYQRTTMRTVAQVKSGNTKTSMTEFGQKSQELETMDAKAVVYIWSILHYNIKQNSWKKARTNILKMQEILQAIMVRRGIPTTWPELTILLSTITNDERKAYLMLSK